MAGATHFPEIYHLERYADVRAALLDARLAIHKPVGRPDGDSPFDPPCNQRPPVRSRRLAPLSGALGEHLSAHSVARIAGRVTALVTDLLDRGYSKGGMDLVADLAYPLPLMVMLDLLGLPLTEPEGLRPLFAAIGAGQEIDSTESQRNAARLAQASIKHWVSRHLDASPSPLVAAIRSVAERDAREPAVPYWCMILLYAGSTTTRGFIANCLARLLEHPDEAALLRNFPALPDTAIDELLRVEGPVRAVGRIAREAMPIGDVHLPRGAVVYLHLDKANRDPARFTDPERVDFSRSPNPHLAFGIGVTRCLGSHLAKLETRTVLTALLPHLPRMTMAAAPEWGPSNVLRERTRLAVQFR